MLTAVRGTEDARTVTVRVDDARRRTEQSGTQRAFAAHVLAGSGHGHDVVFEGTAGSFRFRYRTRRDGQVSLVSASATAGFRGVFEPVDRVLVGWSASGGIRIGIDGKVVLETLPGVPVLMPTTGPFTVVAPEGTLHLVTMDRALVDGLVGVPRTGTWELPVRDAEVHPDSLTELRECVEVLAAAVADDGAPLGMRRTAQTALAETVLRAFGVPADRWMGGRTPSTVELAEAFLDGHCHQALTLADICSAVGVRPRTLQASFMRQHGISPMNFLQGLRLEKARATLLASDRHETSVSEVALEWGFRHLGRFSGHYLRRFGEYPGETLRGATARRAS